MMRVALVMHQFPSLEHPYIFEWVKELLENDIQLTVIAERVIEPPGTGFWSTKQKIWKQVRRINFIDAPELLYFLRSAFSALFHPGKFFRMFRTLWKTEHQQIRTVLRKAFEYLPLLTEEFDLVHFNAPQIAIRRFELKDILRSASLVSFRGQDFTFHPDRYDCLLQEADHLHFISQFLVNQARERGYDGSRHSLIYPTIDTNFYFPGQDTNPVQKDVNRPYIVFSAARLEWVKGWEFALQAVAFVIERGWDIQYYIAGDGELKDLLVYTMDQLGIADRVHLLGWQSPEQVRDWMQKSDIYLLASVEEAFNNSVLQAQACGLPVVCSDEGGLPENIEDGVTGLLAKRRDAWDMADKIETIFSHPEMKSSMENAGCVRARKKFAIHETVHEFTDMYHLVISPKGKEVPHGRE